MRMFIFCAVVTLRRGALLFLATFATFAACFLSKPLFMLFAVPLQPLCPFSTFAVSLPGTFGRTFSKTVTRFISYGFKPF